MHFWFKISKLNTKTKTKTKTKTNFVAVVHNKGLDKTVSKNF
jgi:hypothetical protein